MGIAHLTGESFRLCILTPRRESQQPHPAQNFTLMGQVSHESTMNNPDRPTTATASNLQSIADDKAPSPVSASPSTAGKT
ncbi:MAG: hypothetical protein VKJ64_17405 [Leptolyngbyaceae bacterium]|nr:hypothetical protein [Leptolyngbyaceae bacterium]